MERPPRNDVPRPDLSPFVVFWETTRACDLVCKQRRADARPGRDNDGHGVAFVSHRGEVFPSGFLPLSCGSVRTTPLAEDPACSYRPATLAGTS